ncbi:MAG: O-acetyl-ADP-ribose deacetylase [Candidatus Anammoxibacter sp.]
MIKHINKSELKLIQGDITEQATDAIVNAANNALLGGRGVDGAIHSAGGASILEACKKLGGCRTGEAKITTAGNMKTSYVIHTVGPVWSGGAQNEPDLLKSCYKSSMTIAEEHKLASISFPSISTGVYRFPVKQASEIALNTVADYLKGSTCIRKTVFVLFSERVLNIFKDTLDNIKP